MAVASAEDPPPRKPPSEEELAEFSEWALEFIDFLYGIPTSEDNE